MTSLFENTDWMKTFSDRVDAGRKLGISLRRYIIENPLVVALPRGGVPIALEVARELHAAMDILLVRKIPHPQHPELGIGAVGEDGAFWIHPDAKARWGLSLDDIVPIVEREHAEIRRRKDLYRGTRNPLPVFGRTVILIDDGLATGGTARVAAEFLRKHGAQHIILGVPVCADETCESMGRFIDEVHCLEEASDFHSVSCYYGDFHQLSDNEVQQALHVAWDGNGWDNRRYVQQ